MWAESSFWALAGALGFFDGVRQPATFEVAPHVFS